MRDIILTEFNSNLILDKHTAIVFDTPFNYDIILGRDFIQGLGITINYSKKDILRKKK